MSSGRIFAAAALVASSFALGPACSSSDDEPGTPGGDAGDAGGESGSGGAKATGGVVSSGGASTGGAASSGGSAGFGGTVQCGEETCTTSSGPGTGIDAVACCTDDNECGIKLALAVTCLPRNQFGTVNDDCEPYELQGFSYPGCCRTDGCGVRITIEGLGCVANADLGRPEVPCNQSGAPADGG